MVMQDGKEYVGIELPGVTIPNEVGSPDQPRREDLIRIVTGSEVVLQIDLIEWFEVEDDVKLAPVQAPLPDHTSPHSDPGALKEAVPPFAKNEAIYARDSFDEVEPVRLVGIVQI